MTNDHSTKNAVEEMRHWLCRQRHLPQDLDDKMLHRFAHSCYYDLDKAKSALETFLKLRQSSKELMENRDPESPLIKKALSIACVTVYVLPSSNRRVWIWKIEDPGFDNYDFVQAIKLCVLIMDVVFLTDDCLPDSDIIIFDSRDVNYKFMSTFNISSCRAFIKYEQEALPVRLKQIHVINSPPIIEKIFALIKPLMSKELVDMFFFHTPSSNTLYDFIDKEDLPVDLGGSQGVIKEGKAKIIAHFPRLRDIIARNDFWTAIGKKDGDISMDDGCFRSLNLD